MGKLLIPIQGDYVAPRFDLAAEVVIARHTNGELTEEVKTIIMEKPSDEELCQMIVEEHVTEVVCGGIEELHYNFLSWKKVKIVDRVIADWETALQKSLKGEIKPADVLIASGDISFKL